MKNQYYLWLLIIAICVGLGAFMGFYLAQQWYAGLETRLQALEAQYAASLRQGQEIRMYEVKILIAKSVEEVKNQYDLAIKLGLPLSIAALLASIFGAYQWAAEIAKQKAEAAFKDPETALKENAKILVLTPKGEDESWLQRFMFLMGFPQVTFHAIEELLQLKNDKFDLVMLNVPSDETNTVSKQNALLAEINNGKSVFYFGKGRAINADLDKDGRLSFANAKSQLYGNLINALKYQKML